MVSSIAGTTLCVQGASWTCRFWDGDGPSPWFVVRGIVVLVGLVLFLNWTRSQR